MSAIDTFVSLVGGAAVGWWIARRRVRAPGTADAAGAPPGEVSVHLLPDPAIGWLRRAHGAIGVWIAELDPAEEGPRAERVVDAERLSVGQIVAIDRRLEWARDHEQSGAEIVDRMTFVFRSAGGTAVGMLLADDPADVPQAEEDLQRLLEGIRRKPQSIAMAQARSQEASFESVASVGLRLAYQIERMFAERTADRMVTAEAVIAAAITGNVVRIVGVSGRTDRRLLDSLVPIEHELSRVAQGHVESLASGGETFGGLVADRRRRGGSTIILPIRVAVDGPPAGAAMVWLGNGDDLSPSTRAEVVEALANAAPRLARALDSERQKLAEPVDSLTGLYNQRGFDDALVRQGTCIGALICLDLDHFTALTNALGDAAGEAALTYVARLIRQQIRASDLPARIGGEQFVIWIPEAGLDLGARIAERVRHKIAAAPWEWSGETVPLTASFGVASCPETGASYAELGTQAQAALAAAKLAGRNRIEKAG